MWLLFLLRRHVGGRIGSMASAGRDLDLDYRGIDFVEQTGAHKVVDSPINGFQPRYCNSKRQVQRTTSKTSQPLQPLTL